MTKSETIGEIAKALCECQKELKDVFKGTSGFNYKYASLDKVYDEVRPKYVKHGLSLSHEKSYNRSANTIELSTLLMHSSGEWIEYYGSLPFAQMKQMNDYQASGSGFTYLERYQTSAIFGITSDEDQDAQGEQMPATISDDQAREITQLINQTKSDYQKVLDYAHCADILEMSLSKYPIVKAMLNKKLEAK